MSREREISSDAAQPAAWGYLWLGARLTAPSKAVLVSAGLVALVMGMASLALLSLPSVVDSREARVAARAPGDVAAPSHVALPEQERGRAGDD